MLEIWIVGLCLLAKNEQGSRTVIIPDVHRSVTIMTPRGPADVEPHVSYIAAAASDGDTCFACVKTDKEWRLDLNGDNVTISGTKGGYKEDKQFDMEVPQIRNVCKGFELSIPISASTFVITDGTLFPRRNGEKDVVRESCIKAEKIEGQKIIITATRNGITHTMTLKSATSQIRIVNRYANHLHGKKPLRDNHWLAFYTLAATPVVCDLPAVTVRRWQTTSACSNSGYP